MPNWASQRIPFDRACHLRASAAGLTDPEEKKKNGVEKIKNFFKNHEKAERKRKAAEPLGDGE